MATSATPEQIENYRVKLTEATVETLLGDLRKISIQYGIAKPFSDLRDSSWDMTEMLTAELLTRFSA